MSARVVFSALTMPVSLDRFERIKRLALKDFARGLELDTVRLIVSERKQRKKPYVANRSIVRTEKAEIPPAASASVERTLSETSPSEFVVRALDARMEAVTPPVEILSSILEAIEDAECVENALRAKYGIN